MQFVEFREIIRKRATIEDEWYTEVEKCWNEMADLFTADIEKTILFLDVCTGDEFSWMSEVFEEVSKRVLSRDFIAALRRTAMKSLPFQ